MAICVTVALLLTLSVAQAQAPSKYDTEIIALDREAVRQAYQNIIMHLFTNWMREGETQGPERALVGARRARRGYIAAMTAIEAREHK